MAEGGVSRGPNYLVFFFLAWAQLCLFWKEWSLAGDQDVPGSIYYPLIAITLGCTLDNIRLCLGAMDRSSAYLGLARVCFFLHMVALPMLIGTYATMLTEMGMWNWLGILVHILAVPFVANGLNKYLAEIHDSLEYTEDGGVARYTTKIPDFGLVMSIISVGAVVVTFIAALTFGDYLPFLLMLCVLGVQSLMPGFRPGYSLAFGNLIEVLFIGCLIRVQRNI